MNIRYPIYEGVYRILTLNAVFIDQGIPQGERLVRLNRIAIQQMRVLEDDGGRKLLE